MRLESIVAVLAALPAALCFQEQAPLKGHGKLHGATSADKHAPSYRKALIDLHRNLVTIPSISGDEFKVGQWLVDYLISRDFRADIQFVEPREGTPKGVQRFNVLAWPGQYSNPRPRVLVSSHIDVVPPFISYGIDDGPITKDTVIRGRGAVDAKAAVAAMTIAVGELVAAGRVKKDDVMLVFVVGEEVAGDGMITFSDAAHARDEPPSWHSVIFGEPTESKGYSWSRKRPGPRGDERRSKRSSRMVDDGDYSSSADTRTPESHRAHADRPVVLTARVPVLGYEDAHRRPYQTSNWKNPNYAR